MLWMTVYLWQSGSRAKIIEAEWCSNAIWWALWNYVFYTLTSKNLRFKDNTTVSPSYYFIQLTGGNSASERPCIPQNAESWYVCKEILLWYVTWNNITLDNPTVLPYQNITVQNTCRHWKPYIWFYRSGGNLSGNIDYIRMNKWFTPKEVQAERVFFLHDKDWGNENDKKLLIWDIIVILCGDEECTCTAKTCWKQIGKLHVDARSQTIAFKKCRYYEENWSYCKTREDCRIYDSDDPTLCKEY